MKRKPPLSLMARTTLTLVNPDVLAPKSWPGTWYGGTCGASVMMFSYSFVLAVALSMETR